MTLSNRNQEMEHKKLLFDDELNSCAEDKYGYDDPRDAIFDMYEELFDGNKRIDRERIYKAMRWLVWHFEMERQHRDMSESTFELLDLARDSAIDVAVDKEICYLRKCVTELMDEF